MFKFSGKPLRERKRAVKSGTLCGAVLAVGMSLFVLLGESTPASVDHSRGKSASEISVARKEIQAAFGDRYDVTGAKIMEEEPTAKLLISFDGPGMAELSWPDATRLTVQLEASDIPGPNSYSLDPAPPAPRGKEAAYKIAVQYVKDRYPWALTAQHHETHPVGEKAAFGWITSWRWVRNDVLMPRSIDVQVNRAGRISQLLVNQAPGELDLPKPTVTEEEVENLVRHRFASRSSTVSAVTLRAEKRGGAWRAEWRVAITESNKEPVLVWVDAQSGRAWETPPV
ncbi:hypothetical protein [Streptomyces lavendofoliae]|uniref:hypothetical protein n=1 Tax=Streptomyces lavendofoliae TaxID=67314 RepID=UPI001676AF22|nr:hypothetical protein [Streptomyces lavendofoliae]